MYGIVLEGGGARGAYQIGVWKALRELGIEYQGVAGTSVGALNGAMMVQGDFNKALDIWSDIKPSRVVNIDDELYERVKSLKISVDDTSSILQSIKSIFQNHGMDTAPLHNLLSHCIDENRIRKTGKEFGIVTISLSDLTPLKLFLQDIPVGKLIDYLLASASMPVFQKQRIGNKAFLDGGVWDNLPISLLAQKKYAEIIVIRLVQRGLKKRERNLAANVTLIKPGESLGSLFDFTKERAGVNIELGYYDAMKVFKGYHGIKYCIEVKQDEEYFLKRLLQMDRAKLEGVYKGLGVPDGMPYSRFILEYLAPLLAELLPVTKNASYRDLTLALLERAADKAGIERFRVHRYDEFERRVIRSYRPQGMKVSLPPFLKGNELLLKVKRKQLLDDMTDALVWGIKQG